MMKHMLSTMSRSGNDHGHDKYMSCGNISRSSASGRHTIGTCLGDKFSIGKESSLALSRQHTRLH
jgi:hypothetical protein